MFRAPLWFQSLFPVCHVSHFSSCFEAIVLLLRSSSVWCLDLVLLLVTLLGLLWAWICRSVVFLKFATLWPLFLQNFLCFSLFLLGFPVIPLLRSFWYCPVDLWVCVCSSLITSFSVRTGSFLLICLQIPCLLQSALQSVQWSFHLLIYLQFWDFHLSLFYGCWVFAEISLSAHLLRPHFPSILWTYL